MSILRADEKGIRVFSGGRYQMVKGCPARDKDGLICISMGEPSFAGWKAGFPRIGIVLQFIPSLCLLLHKDCGSPKPPCPLLYQQVSKMLQLLKSLSIAVLAVISAVQAYPEPRACTGYCWAHDPAVIQRVSDGVYFKFNTGTGIQFATSTSLDGSWTIQGYVLPSGSSISNSGSDDPWVSSLVLSTAVC